jgi:hypothetical protein
MRSILKIVIALAVTGAVAAAAPADADPGAHSAVKHHRGRHLHAHHGTASQPLILVPAEDPASRYGGPRYSTCDRINADPMLVGTCR